jgi:zinc and cadmium transporter
MLFELFVSLGIISLVSFVGALTLGIKENKLEHFLELSVAFAAGALLGDVFIHLLPQLAENGFSLAGSFSILFGIIVFFVLEKIIHWHHCHHLKHNKDCPSAKAFSYMSLFGDLLHNLIDGIILASAFIVSPVVGASTAIAIFLHELPQEIGDFGVLVKGGFSKKKALWFNFLSSLTSFMGAFFAIALTQLIESVTPLLIGFAVGSFLYIAGTDFLPQLHEKFETKKAIAQLIVLIFGMLVMVLLLVVE